MYGELTRNCVLVCVCVCVVLLSDRCTCFGSRFRESAQETVRGGEPGQRRGSGSEGLVKSRETLPTDTHHDRDPVLVDTKL